MQHELLTSRVLAAGAAGEHLSRAFLTLWQHLRRYGVLVVDWAMIARRGGVRCAPIITNPAGGTHGRPHQTKEGVMRRLMLLGLILLGVASCAGGPKTDPALMASDPPTVNVTGTWAGDWVYQPASLGSGHIKMTLQQTGSKVTGNVEVSGTRMPRSGPIHALVSGNHLQLLYPTGVTGYLTVEGNTISGELGGLSPADVTMKKVP